MDLSIVIPYRQSGEVRERSFRWVYSRYELTLPECNIIVSDSDPEKPFSRSQSRNLGVDQVRTKYMLLADADTVTNREFVERALEMVVSGQPWVIPYGQKFYVLTNDCSERILGLPSDSVLDPAEFDCEHVTESWGGLIVMRTESFYEVNGYDERFSGWGYEDNSFRYAMDTIIGPFARVNDAWGAHLWHPAPTHTTWEHPQIESNRRLFASYKRAWGKTEPMSQVIAGNRG